MQPDNVLPMPDQTPPPHGGASAPAPGDGGKPARRKRATVVNMGSFSELMEQYALIYGTQTAWDGKNRRIVPVQALRLAMTSDAVKAWLNAPQRHMVLPEQLMFEPGTLDLPPPCINLYDGLAMQPAPGECRPILELLTYLCSESAPTPEERARVVAWVLRWLALPLQRPGTKMRSALVFHGPQGAGKNLMFEIVAAIYGKYALVVGQDQLEDKFNDWASMKLFLIGDEVVARQELYHHKNKLKSFITGETIQINAKMLPLRTEANHVNVVFLSNEHQPLALEPGDRRYMVVWTPPRDDGDLYDRVAACLASGGREAFLAYLLALPMEGFTCFDIPPMTRAKRDLIDLGLKPQERFVREWLGGILPLPLAVCSTEQLYRAFRRWAASAGERWPPTQIAFSKGVEKAANGRLRMRPFKLDQGFNGRDYLRMWMPEDTGPPEGAHAGQWAREAADAFESSLRRYAEADQAANGGGDA